jgi:hypothetical protein
MDRKVKRLLVFYITSALCCTLVFCGGILADKYASSLLTSYDLFQTIKVKKVNMKEAIKNIDVAIAQVRAEMPRNMGQESSEADILLALDILKSRLKSCAISIDTLEKKDDDITLPVTIRGVLSDYHKFMNDLGYIQALRFPFFVISTMSIDKLEREQKEIVIFEIKGALTMRTNFPEYTSGS